MSVKLASDGLQTKDGPQPGFPTPPVNCFGFNCGDGGGSDHKNSGESVSLAIRSQEFAINITTAAIMLR
jgi:hypothetical protein